MVHEHVHYVPEAAGVSRGKEAAADLVDGLAQLGHALVVLPGVVPAPSRDSSRHCCSSWGPQCLGQGGQARMWFSSRVRGLAPRAVSTRAPCSWLRPAAASDTFCAMSHSQPLCSGRAASLQPKAKAASSPLLLPAPELPREEGVPPREHGSPHHS